MPEVNRNDDSYWHWGGLYYSNPDDPARWVKKRVGAGPTPNMAHPLGKILLASAILFLAIVLAIALF